MEIIYFTLSGIVLYLVSDWVLQRLESALGRRLEYRTLYFFIIITVLATTSFALIRRLKGV